MSKEDEKKKAARLKKAAAKAAAARLTIKKGDPKGVKLGSGLAENAKKAIMNRKAVIDDAAGY